MRDITPAKPLRTDEVRINTQAIAAVVNLQCKGLHGVLGKNVRLENIDRLTSGQVWNLELPAEFAGFIAPDEMCILSITILKNVLEPILPSTGIIKPGDMN